MADVIDEGYLLKQISLGGDPARSALKPLYDYYSPRFVGFYCRRGLAPEDAEELSQEAFIKIVRSARKAGDITAPRAWLWRLARSVMLDYLKSPAARSGVDIPHLSPFMEADLDVQDLQDCVQRQFTAFAHTAPEAAQAISWAVVEGFNAREIADLLGRSHGATREFLSQVRKKLSDVLAICREYLS